MDAAGVPVEKHRFFHMMFLNARAFFRIGAGTRKFYAAVYTARRKSESPGALG